MQAWHFTEMPYPHFPPDAPTIRVNLPNAHFDPKIGADLYNRYLDEHMIADELGLDIMLNEHHQTPTCIDTAAPLEPRHPRPPDQARAASASSATRSATATTRSASPRKWR